MKFEGLPRFENQSPKERSPEYIKILAEIESLSEATEEEQQEYIEKRLAVLTDGAEVGEMSTFGRGMHKGFLGTQMEIRRNMMVDPFIMDDPDLYLDLFKIIKRFREAEEWKEKSFREIMPNAVQWTLSKYFDNIAAGEETEIKNRKFYLDHTSAESPLISIKELKGKGFAVCAEKGAAAQNLLAFVGLESDLIASSGCRIPAEAEEGGHYYILIHGPKGDLIYDPTNPRMLLDKDNKFVSYSPAMYPITEEQTQHLFSGESIAIEHVDDKISGDGQKVPVKSNRLYAGPRQR